MGACRTPHAARRTPQTRLQSLPGVGRLLPGPRKQGGRGALPALANVCRSAALVPCRALGAGDQQAASVAGFMACVHSTDADFFVVSIMPP